MTVPNNPPPLPRPRSTYGVKATFVHYDRSAVDVWWWGGERWVDDRRDAARMHEDEVAEVYERITEACRSRPDDGRMGSYAIIHLLDT